MAYMLKKTVVIGLGGTGMHAVLHMKKKLLDTYGESPPMIKFLVIDTTDKDRLQVEGGEVALEPGEFLKLEVKNPGSLIKTNEEVKKWLPSKVPKFALTSGAKQVRPLGRLAVFANASPLESKIDGLISSARDFRVGRRYSDKYELLSENIVVNIVCSLSGGTGSGCFLDVTALTRKNLSSTDKVIGYFLFPDIFVGKPATDNVEPNTFGAMKELNYFFTEEGKIRYTLGGRERKIEEGLFNAVYLINNINRQGVEYSDIEDLQEFIGMGMFLQSSSTGKGASDIIDNLEALLVEKKWFSKPTVYSSFGVGELVYSGDWFADLYAKEIALDVLQKVFIGGDVSQVKESAESFIDKIGIREDTADRVIDNILPPGDFKKFPLPSDFRKEIIPSTLGKRKLYLNNVQRDLGEASKGNLAELKEEKINVLNELLIEKMSKPRQLEFFKSFLATFVGRLTEFKNMMIKERGEYAKQKEELEEKYRLVKLEIDKASRKLFGTKAAIEGTLKKFKGLVDRESSLILEIERREGAIEFFTYLIDEAKKWHEKLSGLSQYCSTLTQELNQDIQRKKLEKRGIKPFVHEIEPAFLRDWIPTVEPQDFLIWIKNEKQMDILKLSEMRVSEVKTILLEYGSLQEKVKEIKEKRIDDILEELSTDKKMEYVGLLDKMAAPLWQYDQGVISGKYKTTNIYLFGVENPDDTIFKPEEIQTAISSPYQPSIIGTGDPKRVICFKVEAAVPAFVVSKMPQYKEKYMISEKDKPFSYHINKEWEKKLPALFPREEEEEKIRKYWSLALANPFNLISKKGEYYYIKSEKKGERTRDYMLKLAQGRAEAMKAFFDDTEFVEEIEENIRTITQKIGEDKVMETLKEYGDDLEKKARRQTEQIRKQVELELEDIENYIKSLSSL